MGILAALFIASIVANVFTLFILIDRIHELQIEVARLQGVIFGKG